MGVRFGLAVLGVALTACAAPGLAGAGLGLLKPDPKVAATFIGHGGYSADGLGQTDPGGTIQADVPAGSQVVNAWLYGSYDILNGGAVPAADFTVDFDGTNVTLRPLTTIVDPANRNIRLTSARADVTAQVATKVGTGGRVANFIVGSDPEPDDLDGVALVVIYSNPAKPTTTIAILDGGAETTGETASFAFASPVDPTRSGFAAIMSLGIGFSYQGAAGSICGTYASQGVAQFSTVDVNGKRLTSCAGNYDDGAQSNGALLTVGGVGDGTDNPDKPDQTAGPRSGPATHDDELYNLKPFLTSGDTQLNITTVNPSGDDLVFLAAISITAEAGVSTTGGAPPPVAGKTFNAQVVRGKVTCRAAGSRIFKPVTTASQFKVGSECDATRGVIRITSAAGPAKTKRISAKTPTQTADFFQGRFKLSQATTAKSYTTLTLSGGDFKKTCAKKTRSGGSATAADPLVRKLWGKGKGRFRTKGRYSSASVRGTYWNTEDHCNSTVTRVRQGSVIVSDNVAHKKVTVTAGHEYTAKAKGRQRRAAAPARRTWLDHSWLPSLWSSP